MKPFKNKLKTVVFLICLISLISSVAHAYNYPQNILRYKNKPLQNLSVVAAKTTKLSTSWFFKKRYLSARGFAAKTQCYGNSDSGIIVTSKNTGITRFNDNSNLTGGNKKGSYVSISKKEFSFVENFTVYVFSMNKTPAFCTLFISKNQGLTWKKLGAQSFGGALVDLGSLQKNDFVELKTQGGGFKQEESHMLLFNIFNSRKRALHSPKRSLFNKHPKIEIKDHSWQGLGNKVLIGKEKKAQQNTWTPKAQLRVLSFGLFKERGAGF